MTSASVPRDSAASQHAAGDDSRFGLRAAVVLILAAILFFARLGARALWSSEFRWAEIAREMLVTQAPQSFISEVLLRPTQKP